MTHAIIVALAAAGVVAQVAVAVILVAGAFELAGVAPLLSAVRRLLWGYELWLAFLVAAVGTGGSLFFSEVAEFEPCELCWYQRICMYPLSAVLLLAAAARDHRVARYLLPLPVVGAGLSVYHLLIENGVVGQPQECLISSPGGCATKWIDEFGFMTIPTLALTGFVLTAILLILASVDFGAHTAQGA